MCIIVFTDEALMTEARLSGSEKHTHFTRLVLWCILVSNG